MRFEPPFTWTFQPPEPPRAGLTRRYTRNKNIYRNVSIDEPKAKEEGSARNRYGQSHDIQ